MPELFIVTRKIGADSARLLKAAPTEARVLLLGRGLFSDHEQLGDRKLLALEEEVRELGLEGVLKNGVERLSCKEVASLISESEILNLE